MLFPLQPGYTMTVWAAASDAHATSETAKRNMLALRTGRMDPGVLFKGPRLFLGWLSLRRAVCWGSEAALSSEVGRDYTGKTANDVYSTRQAEGSAEK